MGTATREDADLVRAALSGDAGSLGLLLARHEASMRAVAVARLGYGPAADDAVQEAMIVGLRRLPDLRDPAAAGAWLQAIVRNECRMAQRRTARTVPLGDVVRVEARAEERLERHALRDWVWHAIGQLSEPLQLVLLLRHFGEARSYAEIAAICGIPVGTVRSRLSDARRQLRVRLTEAAEVAHDDVGSLTRERCARLGGLLDAAVTADLYRLVADLTHPEMVMLGWWGMVGAGRMNLTERGAAVAAGGSGPITGRDLLRIALSDDAEAGVRERVLEVNASSRFTLLDCQLLNPDWDPEHCPPAVLWVVTMRDERIDGVRLYHPRAA